MYICEATIETRVEMTQRTKSRVQNPHPLSRSEATSLLLMAPGKKVSPLPADPSAPTSSLPSHGEHLLMRSVITHHLAELDQLVTSALNAMATDPKYHLTSLKLARLK